jgi:hypothetical protein
MLTRAAFGLTIALASVSGSLAAPHARDQHARRLQSFRRGRRRTALPLRVCPHGLGLAIYAAAGFGAPVK